MQRTQVLVCQRYLWVQYLEEVDGRTKWLVPTVAHTIIFKHEVAGTKAQ